MLLQSFASVHVPCAVTAGSIARHKRPMTLTKAHNASAECDKCLDMASTARVPLLCTYCVVKAASNRNEIIYYAYAVLLVDTQHYASCYYCYCYAA
jgi:hypothetical protein